MLAPALVLAALLGTPTIGLEWTSPADVPFRLSVCAAACQDPAAWSDAPLDYACGSALPTRCLGVTMAPLQRKLLVAVVAAYPDGTVLRSNVLRVRARRAGATAGSLHLQREGPAAARRRALAGA